MSEKQIEGPIDPTRAKLFKIISSGFDLGQFERAIEAISTAGMSFRLIADAGRFLGYQVEEHEITVPMVQTGKVGEFMKHNGAVWAWQQTGEMISVTPQLPSGNISITSGPDQPPVPDDYYKAFEDQPAGSLDPNIRVIEGIAVTQQKPTQIGGSDPLDTNPFLKAPARWSEK